MNYSHLLFDFDHTLFDTDQSEALSFNHALELNGIEQPDRHLAQYQVINQALWRQVEQGTITPNELKAERFEKLATEAGLDYNAEAVADAYTEGLADFGELYDGARQLIEQLANVFTLGMVTNGLGPVQRGRLDRVGLGGVFEPLVISGEVGVSKPRSEIFNYVFDEFPGVDRSAFLMIGDSLTSDMQGAMNAGIDTCWFNQGRAASPATKPKHEIHKLQDLRSVVGQPHP